MDVLLDEREMREHLLATCEEYRDLAAEHQTHSERLERLLKRPYLTENERLEEITLKKKKLALKDQMYAILQKYRKELEAQK